MITNPQLPWMDTEVMHRMVRQQDLHLFGCLTVLTAYSGPAGEIAYPKAVKVLAAAPEMNELKAEKSISRLEDAGWVSRTDETLSIIGYGSSIAPDYARRNSD